MKLKTTSIGAVLLMLAVFSIMAWFGDKRLEEAEERLESIPEPIVPQLSVKEQIIEDMIAAVNDEPIIDNIESEGNKMHAPYSFIGLDDELQIYMEGLCADMEINFFLAAAIMKSESNFNPDAVGDNGSSVGLFQVNKCWWAEMEEAGIDVHTPKGNIQAGLKIIKDLMNKFPDDVAAVIQCYKCGEYQGKKLMAEDVYLSCIAQIVNEAMDWQTREEP